MNAMTWMAAGPVAWIILGCGLLAMGVFLERAWHLHRARIKADDFLEGIVNILKRGNVREALTICSETPGPVAYLLKTAIQNRGESRGELQAVLDKAGAAEISRMERRLVVVATVAQIAPLLGLFGTVVGMVETLLLLQHQAPLVWTGDVTGGLYRALTATGAGLIVAIPCYAAFNLLVVKIDRIVLDMERAATDIVGFLRNPANIVDAAGGDE